MRANFRQGIIRHPSDIHGQTFLSLIGGKVTINTFNGDVTVTIAHRHSNYTITETTTVVNAWAGPFVGGTDYWLYWDIDYRSGLRTFGHTTLSPIVSASSPASPSPGQMWFDTTTDRMREFNGSSWIERIRCFACMIQSGSIIKAFDGTNNFYQSQIDDNTTVSTGSILFDSNDKPMKRSNGAFFTSADSISYGIDTISSVSLDAFNFQAVAQTNLGAYTVVALSDFNAIDHAGIVTSTSGAIMGIIEHAVGVGEWATVRLSGVIHNNDWNWSVNGAPVYYSITGAVTDQARPGFRPIGYIIDPTKIVFVGATSNPDPALIDDGSEDSLFVYSSAQGTVNIDVNYDWHTMHQVGDLTITMDTPVTSKLIDVTIELISNGDPVTWPNGDVETYEQGSIRLVKLIYRPEIMGIDGYYFRSEEVFYISQ